MILNYLSKIIYIFCTFVYQQTNFYPKLKIFKVQYFTFMINQYYLLQDSKPCKMWFSQCNKKNHFSKIQYKQLFYIVIVNNHAIKYGEFFLEDISFNAVKSSYHLYILMNCVHVLLVSSIGFDILQRNMISPFE